MRSWVQVLETASCRNARKDCVHKTRSGQTLFRIRRKRAPGIINASFASINSTDLDQISLVNFENVDVFSFSLQDFPFDGFFPLCPAK
jgi:hypothetical protein